MAKAGPELCRQHTGGLAGWGMAMIDHNGKLESGGGILMSSKMGIAIRLLLTVAITLGALLALGVPALAATDPIGRVQAQSTL